MAKFELTTPDGQKYELEATDEKQALEAWEKFQASSYTGPEQQTTVNGVTTTTPEGMTFDPNTGAMVDTKALSEMKLKGAEATNLGTQMAKGLPFVGSWLDEAMGWLGSSDKPYDSQEVNAELYRQLDKRTAEQYPKTTTGLQIGGALSTIPATIAAAPAIPGVTAASNFAGRYGLLGKAVGGAVAAAPISAAEGYITGYGDQKPGVDRGENAKSNAAVSAILGTALGAAAPLASSLLGASARKLMDSATVNRQLAKIGIDRPTADRLRRSLMADDVLGGKGAQRLADAGPDAMLADAGQSTRSLLDSAVRFSDAGGQRALTAVTDRANKQKTALDVTFDAIMGKTKGMREASRNIAQSTAAERSTAYEVLKQPIDYATPEGRTIEKIFQTTPKSIKSRAIEIANMYLERADGQKQIMADIADDGTVKFREMPNAFQADQLKRALQKIEQGGTESLTGKKTPEAELAGEIATELRDAMIKALPGYDKALKAGKDKILSDQGLQLGDKLLSDAVSREEVKAFVDNAPDEAKAQILIGLRRHLDELQAKVKGVPSDVEGTEARAAIKAWKDLSSEANREKVATVIGQEKAKMLFRDLDRTGTAFELKMGVARNSATATRTKDERDVADMVKSGPMASLKRGEIINTPKQVWQQLAGGTPEAEQAQMEQIWGQIAQLLTGPRGPQADAALQSLLKAYQAGTANQAASRLVGKGLTGAIALPAYQQMQPSNR